MHYDETHKEKVRTKEGLWEYRLRGMLRPVVVDRPIEPEAREAFESLLTTDDLETFYPMHDWVEAMRDRGISMLENGVPSVKLHSQYCHGFDFRLIDGVPSMRMKKEYRNWHYE